MLLWVSKQISFCHVKKTIRVCNLPTLPQQNYSYFKTMLMLTRGSRLYMTGITQNKQNCLSTIVVLHQFEQFFLQNSFSFFLDSSKFSSIYCFNQLFWVNIWVNVLYDFFPILIAKLGLVLKFFLIQYTFFFFF